MAFSKKFSSQKIPITENLLLDIYIIYVAPITNWFYFFSLNISL